MMKKIILAAMFVSTALGAQTIVPAIITGNQVWTKAGNPYIVSQNTLIDTGASLLIKPGVEIKGNNTVRLIVNGELQATGTFDSMVKFNNLRIEFTNKAKDYNPNNLRGALISYCWFDSVGINSALQVINFNQTDGLVKNCKFTEFYYGIYITSGNIAQKVEVLDCEFINTVYKQGYGIYSSNSKSSIKARNNYFKNNSILIFGEVDFKENIAHDMYSCDFNLRGSSTISCNEFKRVQRAVEFTFSSIDSNGSNDIIGNTFDNLGTNLGASYPMVKFTRNLTVYPMVSTHINNNNFLNHNYPGGTLKVQISGSNPNLTTSTPVDMKYNYWATADTNVIKSNIKDYTDDITIFGKVDYSNFLSSMDTLCGDSFGGGGGSTCNASFIPALDSSQTNNGFTLYLIDNSTGADSSTTYTWTFGDTTINGATPQYFNSGFGKVQVCLTIFNAATNCNSTYCDSVGLDSSGNFLRVNGFFINVLTWEDFKNLNTKSAKSIKNVPVTVYPNPSQNYLDVQLPLDLVGNTQIEAYSVTGKKQWITSKLQANNARVDCSNLSDGIYFLQISNGNVTSKIRFIVTK